MENKNSNPIVQEVKEKFETVKQMTKIFATSNGAINGLIITGNAGIGKTHFVRQAFIETGTKDRTDEIKGSSITAPAFYYKLWMNRMPGQILVLDDVDLVQKSKAEVSAILDLMKGATEPTKGERILSWLRASVNALFRENGVPESFDFQGSIVWITNETQESLAKACGPHWNAISSRFRQVPVWLDDKESLMYTIYLIEEAGLLGKNCQAKEGGYSEDVIQHTVQYLKDNWKSMDDITPRVAVKIADTIETYPNDWKIYVEYAK
jgi:hypothetical protein